MIDPDCSIDLIDKNTKKHNLPYGSEPTKFLGYFYSTIGTKTYLCDSKINVADNVSDNLLGTTSNQNLKFISFSSRSK